MSAENSNTPNVTLQIVHLDGEKQGQIDEFNRSRISIGRDKSCDVVIDADARGVSRKHGEILHESGRFIYINHGQNGTLVNGKRIDQGHLQQGDIIELSPNGPRISFLTQYKLPENAHTAMPLSSTEVITNDPAISRSQLPEETIFTIQYGTYVRSVRKPICRFGRDIRSDFVIEHPSVHPAHAEVTFKGNEFFLRDLTGTATTTVNQRDARVEIILKQGDIIELGKRGPQFRFLGEGRFIEFTMDHAKPMKHSEAQPVFDCHLAFSNTHGDFERPRGVLSWIKHHIEKIHE